MKGLLKSKSPLNQFLVLICVALASFFLVGMISTVILSSITGVDLGTLADSSKWNFKDERLVNTLRGMQFIQFIALFVIPTFLCAKLFSFNSNRYLGLRKPNDHIYWLLGVAILLFAIPLVNILGLWNQNVQLPDGIARWMQKQEEEAARSVRALLASHTPKDLVINIVCIAGFAAVGEELLFRGIAQRLLIRIFKSPLIGILVAAFLFSAMHMQFYGFVPRLLLGVLLGYIYWYSGSLWVAILAHFVYDAFLIVIVYADPVALDRENSFKFSNIAAAALGSAAIVAALFLLMKKKSVVTYSNEYAEDLTPVKDHPF